jgi:acetoin utilization protein AcuB
MSDSSNLMIKTVMHPLPHSIGATQNLATAKEIMAEHGIRHLPVLEGGALVGILSDRDIHFSTSVDKVPADQILVRDCFTPEPYIVEGNTLVSEVAKVMAHQQLGCALVVENSKLIGIFTAVDACRLLSEVLSGEMEQ